MAQLHVSSAAARARRETRDIATGEPPKPKNPAQVAGGKKGAAVTAAIKQAKAAARVGAILPPNGMALIAIRALTATESARTKARETIGSALPGAAQFLSDLVHGLIDGATVRDRFDASKLVLTVGGVCVMSTQQKGNSDPGNSIPDMSRDELRAFIQAGRLALATHDADDAVIVVSESVSESVSYEPASSSDVSVTRDDDGLDAVRAGGMPTLD